MGGVSLIPHEKLHELLRHPSHKVRGAALAYVQPSDAQDEVLVAEITHCLCASDTYTAAEAALWRLKFDGMPHVAQDEVLKQLQEAVRDIQRMAQLPMPSKNTSP